MQLHASYAEAWVMPPSFSKIPLFLQIQDVPTF